MLKFLQRKVETKVPVRLWYTAKEKLFQCDEEDDDLEDGDPEGVSVNPEPNRTAYDAYIEEFFKNMKAGNNEKDPFKDLKNCEKYK